MTSMEESKYETMKLKIDLQVITMALKYASECHADQRRKDSKQTPYINHPIDVMEFLTSHGVTDRDTIVAAILHDVIEDTQGTYEDIKDRFGEKVAKYVLECSDDKTLHKITRKRHQISHAPLISDEAKLVKLADKYSNIYGLLKTPPEKWTKKEIVGYVYWGFAVCKKMYGVNKSIDKSLQDLFKDHKINLDLSDDDLQKELEEYYKVIDKSE